MPPLLVQWAQKLAGASSASSTNPFGSKKFTVKPATHSWSLLGVAGGLAIGAGVMVYFGPDFGFSGSERIWTSVAGGAVGAAVGFGASMAMGGWEMLILLLLGGAAIATGAILWEATSQLGETSRSAIAAAPAVIAAVPPEVLAAAAA